MTLTVHSGMGPGPVLYGCKICPLLILGKTKLKFQPVAGFDLNTRTEVLAVFVQANG